MKPLRGALMGLMTALVVVLVLQAMAYGLSFALDPAAGVKEFGYERPTVVEGLTIGLVGLVGVGMVGAAALLALALLLMWLRNSAGAYIGLVVGGVYVLSGLCAWRAEWWWDAGFYCATGGLLMILSLVLRWTDRRVAAGRGAAA